MISNVATGETGLRLADALRQRGARVTLLLGPVNACCLPEKIKVIRFSFFEDLKLLLERELRRSSYEFVIHTAAVSDYRPSKVYKQKLSSDRNNLKLDLVATPKLIETVKKIDPETKLVGFKLEPKSTKSRLLSEAGKLMKKSGADIVVANACKGGNYTAYVYRRHCVSKALRSKTALIKELIKTMGGWNPLDDIKVPSPKQKL